MNGCVRIGCLAALLAAVRVSGADATMISLRAAHDVAPDTDPNSEFWSHAPHVIAERDSAGKPVPRYATEVRSRWTSGNLYFLFICPYHELHLKPNPSTATETNELWKWDVAEVFLGSDFRDIRHYREFEISPQGEWIDLDVDLHNPHHEDGWVWNSGFQVAARIDHSAKIWYGAMRIPFSSIATAPALPGMRFRMNLFRGEGPPEKWQSVTWQPPLAGTFHTPERFGLLELVDAPDQAALTAAREAFLDDLIRPHDYAPGKNSFLIQGMKKGQRRTVLSLQGAGSVRHVWSTWSVPAGEFEAPPGAVRMLVFVDGEATAAMDGPIEELCRAAGAMRTRDVPLPAFIFEGAYNLYTPILFARGVRIEIEALKDLDEFYTQIDYRQGAHADQARTGIPGSSLRSGTINGTELTVHGPGILRRLTFRGSGLSDARLRIYWDEDTTPSVEAPLRYFFADFVNAAVETGPDWMTCFFPMPFRKEAHIVVETPPGAPKPASIEYALESTAVADSTPYFHASFQESSGTNGYTQFPVLRVRGEGLFVGMNLFDSGHNHGGGDAALIDAGTPEPRVLHGICGEDYFSFAWHRTGMMTPLTGAPLHARRYRLHLEDPYPFHESLQFLFGAFAGLQPKSVAFWYQVRGPAEAGEWRAMDVPWKALGPLGSGAAGAQTYNTRVVFKDPLELQEAWQDVDMVHGFADLTYLFRHYVFTSSGTGYVAGASRTELTTSVFSATGATVDALFGHDDALTVAVNGMEVASLPALSGFAASAVRLPLHRGWNALRVVVSNEENTDWRWCGLSFAIRPAAARALRFSTSPPEVSGPASSPAS